jgi:hypothetical protein
MINEKANKTSLLAIILANLVPLAGVLFWGWTVFSVVFLFWLESLVIGFFNVLKMLFAQGTVENLAMNHKPQNSGCAKLFMIPFFTVHYGMFMLVQGIFIFIFLGKDLKTEPDIATNLHLVLGRFFWWAFIILIINHLISFIFNYWLNGAYRRSEASKLMFAPYSRVFIQQFVIIGGAFLLQIFPTNLVFLALLVGLKIVADIAGHYFAEVKS